MQWRQCSWARPSLNRWKPRALTRHCHSRPIESSKALRKDTVEDCCWKWKLQCTSGRNKRAVMSIGEQIFVTTRDYPLKNGPLKSHPCCPSQLGIRWHSRFQKRHCSTQIRRITSNMKMPTKHLHATWSSVLKGGLLQSLSQLISEIPVTVFTFPIVSLSIHKLERWLVHLAPETLAMPVCVYVCCKHGVTVRGINTVHWWSLMYLGNLPTGQRSLDLRNRSPISKTLIQVSMSSPAFHFN